MCVGVGGAVLCRCVCVGPVDLFIPTPFTGALLGHGEGRARRRRRRIHTTLSTPSAVAFNGIAHSHLPHSQVLFSDLARDGLAAAVGARRLRFYQDASTAQEAITQTLQLDIRSVHQVPPLVFNHTLRVNPHS